MDEACAPPRGAAPDRLRLREPRQAGGHARPGRHAPQPVPRRGRRRAGQAQAGRPQARDAGRQHAVRLGAQHPDGAVRVLSRSARITAARMRWRWPARPPWRTRPRLLWDAEQAVDFACSAQPGPRGQAGPRGCLHGLGRPGGDRAFHPRTADPGAARGGPGPGGPAGQCLRRAAREPAAASALCAGLEAAGRASPNCCERPWCCWSTTS